MEFLKLVKVEVQKISIYLCCNTWIWSYQWHVITTCSVWGEACKQETRKQKQMQGHSGEASGTAFGMGLHCPAPQSVCFPDLYNSKCVPQGGPEQLYLELSCSWGIVQVTKQRAAKSGSQTCHNTPGSLEHRAVTAGSRAGAQGNQSCSVQNIRTAVQVQYKIAGKTELTESCVSRKAISALPNLQKYHHLTFLFSFLMHLLHPISIQVTWSIGKKKNVDLCESQNSLVWKRP